MSFRSVPALWLAALLPLALWFLLARERVRLSAARRFASERLRGVTSPARGLRPWLLALALTAALAALAGPSFGYRLVPVDVRESNRILVIDVSNSMGAADVGTSRLAAARALAARLIVQQHGRVGAVIFEGVAEIVSPLTTDADAVAALVDTLQPGETGEPGSDLGGAVLAALRLLESDPGRSGDIVLISDGEDQKARVGEAVAAAKNRGVSVSTIRVGTSSGGTIPTGDGPLRDEQGEIVTTRSSAEALQELAAGTGGRALDNPFGEKALDPLLTAARGSAESREIRVPIDRYQWPLSIALFLFLGASLLHRGAE